jgi:hypothetical protein
LFIDSNLTGISIRRFKVDFWYPLAAGIIIAALNAIFKFFWVVFSDGEWGCRARLSLTWGFVYSPLK